MLRYPELLGANSVEKIYNLVFIFILYLWPQHLDAAAQRLTVSTTVVDSILTRR